jgi:hypothetical protein
MIAKVRRRAISAARPGEMVSMGRGLAEGGDGRNGRGTEISAAGHGGRHNMWCLDQQDAGAMQVHFGNTFYPLWDAGAASNAPSKPSHTGQCNSV